jgi:hypothetical protein
MTTLYLTFPGTSKLVLTSLSNSIDKDSIRVSGGKGTADITILEVSYNDNSTHPPNFGDRVTELNAYALNICCRAHITLGRLPKLMLRTSVCNKNSFAFKMKRLGCKVFLRTSRVRIFQKVGNLIFLLLLLTTLKDQR